MVICETELGINLLVWFSNCSIKT